MRDLKKIREKHEFSLDNIELALVFAALLLLLVLSFSLGVMAGRGMKEVVLVQTPAEGFTPSSIEASAITVEASTGAPQTTAAAEPQFTFYETLTKVTPETVTPVEKTVAPVEKTKLPPADVKGGKYSIQLSSSTDKNRSRRRVDELKKRGYPAFLEEADLKEKGKWYRVKVGHFASRDDATRYAISMRKKEKISNFVVVSGE